MRYSPLAFVLCAIGAVVACVNHNSAICATEPQDSDPPLQQRVHTLEQEVLLLRGLVNVLRAEQLRDMLPVKQSAIVGKWVASPEDDQQITLTFHPNGNFDIAGRGEPMGYAHGTGAWKLNKMQVDCTYQYDKPGSLRTQLSLELVSKDVLTFAGTVYRRSVSANPTAQTRGK